MSIDAFTENNLHNYVAQSDTHLNTKEMECWLGIDEAGRGPVLGRYEWWWVVVTGRQLLGVASNCYKLLGVATPAIYSYKNAIIKVSHTF